MKKRGHRRTSVPTGVRFTPEDRKVLKALSAKLGLGTAQVLRLAIRRLAEIEQAEHSYGAGKALPVWKMVAEIGERVPDDVWVKLPTDLAKNHEHYLYGSPKEEE